MGSGRRGIAWPRRHDLVLLGDKETARRRALGIIFGVEFAWNIVGLTRAHARQRRHDDAMLKVGSADLDRRKKRGMGHGSAPSGSLDVVDIDRNEHIVGKGKVVLNRKRLV